MASLFYLFIFKINLLFSKTNVSLTPIFLDEIVKTYIFLNEFVACYQKNVNEKVYFFNCQKKCFYTFLMSEYLKMKILGFDSDPRGSIMTIFSIFLLNRPKKAFEYSAFYR